MINFLVLLLFIGSWAFLGFLVKVSADGEDIGNPIVACVALVAFLCTVSSGWYLGYQLLKHTVKTVVGN